MSLSEQDLEDMYSRFTVLADHYTIAGTATHHDVESRAYGKGYSDAWREAAAYLHDAMCWTEPNQEDDMPL